jgi:hypothetical protein
MAIDHVSEKAAALQPTQGLAAPKYAPPLPAHDAGMGTPAPGDQVLLSGNQDLKYQQLQQKNERVNATASAIRNTDRSLESLGQNIDALKVPLEAIIKNFPPFSPQDEARQKFLMKYSSLRREIDDLTLPLPPDVIQARKAEALPAPLPSDVTDSQIADHVAKLDAIGGSLGETRAGMAADTAALVHDGRFSRIFSGPNGAQTPLFEGHLTENAAAQKSAEVGRQFATVVSQGVAATGSQFLKGLS